MTPKQVLLGHLRERHRQAASPVTARWTLAQLKQLHGRDHHRRHLSHLHAGVDLGPGSRPEGWYTGEGVVERS